MAEAFVLQLPVGRFPYQTARICLILGTMRVQTGCRDCTMCTGHAFSGFGRSVTRGSADILTLGVTALARKRCRGCGHPMDEHHTEPQVVHVVHVNAEAQPASAPHQPATPVGPAPGWYSDPFDPAFFTWWTGRAWVAESKRPRR